eukprot:2712605-Rhodomonas_salina.9
MGGKSELFLQFNRDHILHITCTGVEREGNGFCFAGMQEAVVKRSGDFGKDEGVVSELGVPSPFALPCSPVHNSKQLFDKFRRFTCMSKKSIPEGSKYVLLVHITGISRKRDFICVHFCFKQVRELFSFFNVWKQLQTMRSCGCFLMECTLLQEEKKWVIDVDGNLEELVKE